MSHKNLNPANPAEPKRVAIVISDPGISDDGKCEPGR